MCYNFELKQICAGFLLFISVFYICILYLYFLSVFYIWIAIGDPFVKRARDVIPLKRLTPILVCACSKPRFQSECHVFCQWFYVSSSCFYLLYSKSCLKRSWQQNIFFQDRWCFKNRIYIPVDNEEINYFKVVSQKRVVTHDTCFILLPIL